MSQVCNPSTQLVLLVKEYDYFNWRGCKIKHRPGKSRSGKHVDEMKQILDKQVFKDFLETISSLKNITTSISYPADKAEFVDDCQSAQLPSFPDYVSLMTGRPHSSLPYH